MASKTPGSVTHIFQLATTCMKARIFLDLFLRNKEECDISFALANPWGANL
jgi:hypothetical protein